MKIEPLVTAGIRPHLTAVFVLFHIHTYYVRFPLLPWCRISGYVEQQDMHSAVITVREVNRSAIVIPSSRKIVELSTMLYVW